MFDRPTFFSTLSTLFDEPDKLLEQRNEIFRDFMRYCDADAMIYLVSGGERGSYTVKWFHGNVSDGIRQASENSDSTDLDIMLTDGHRISFNADTGEGRWCIISESGDTHSVRDCVVLPLNGVGNAEGDDNSRDLFVIVSRPGWTYRDHELDVMTTIARMLGACLLKASRMLIWREQLRTSASITRLYTVLHESMLEESLLEAFSAEVCDRFGIEALYIFARSGANEDSRLFYSTGTISPSLLGPLKECLPTEECLSRLIAELPEELRQRTIALPLLTKLTPIGMLALVLERHERGDHDEEQSIRSIISQLAAHVAIGLEHCRLYHTSRRLSDENEIRLWKFSLIYELSYLFREAMSRDRRLHLILTAITLGDGMGFNRAILLMVDQKRNVLEGMMGIGPSSGEEAGRVWRSLHRDDEPYQDWISTLMQSKSYEESDFHRQVVTISLPIVPESGVLALTVLEKKSFHMRPESDLPRCPRDIQDLFLAEEFATAPLMSGEKVIGVIAVDNYFNRRPIDSEDVKMLGLFANQAGVSLEISMLHERLKELTNELEQQHQQLIKRERLGSLGELARAVVHEIRNPLVAIGGFARKLVNLKTVEQEKERKYLNIIIQEVDRLEKILHNISLVARDSDENYHALDITIIINDLLFLFENEIKKRNIQLVRVPFVSLPPIMGNDGEIRQIITNLLLNSIEAMADGGTLTVDAYSDSETGDYLCISISDTGGGIEQEAMSNIFNPFFTTKEKGSGLGLTLTHRLVERHRGSIKVVNRQGEGVTFMVMFPVCPEASA